MASLEINIAARALARAAPRGLAKKNSMFVETFSRFYLRVQKMAMPYKCHGPRPRVLRASRRGEKNANVR